MIYTITFSPSIDYVINTNNNFDRNNLNRISDYELLPGGKGINASIILKRIGFENKAITFLNGPTKNLFLELIKKEELELIDFESENDTRINIKMFAADANFEINGQRAKILNSEFHKINELIDKMNEEDFVFLMGICDESILKSIVEKLYLKKIPFALDIDSKVVLDLLKYKPFIIKPNRFELEQLIDSKLETNQQIKDSMIKLLDKGLQNIIVSDGKNGSFFASSDRKVYKINLLKKFDIISTVGAGDTLISSFTILYLKTQNIIKSLKEATSLSIGTSCVKFLASKEDLQKYQNWIEVIEI